MVFFPPISTSSCFISLYNKHNINLPHCNSVAVVIVVIVVVVIIIVIVAVVVIYSCHACLQLPKSFVSIWTQNHGTIAVLEYFFYFLRSEK